jgi:hypothetical protein
MQTKGLAEMKYVYNDGGRAAAGFKGSTGDCVTRAIAIATGLPYREVYDLVNSMAHRSVRTSHALSRGPVRHRSLSSARTGVFKPDTKKILARLGWKWTPTMGIGTGCKVHLASDELPTGRLIVSVSKHLVAVIDGVIHDTHNPDRGGTRCVYGYWQPE